MKSLKKLMAMFILGVPFALLPAGCAMGVDDSNPDDSASVEASESQVDAELQSADVTPGLEPLQRFDGRERCRDRCFREYRRCKRFDRDFDRGDRHGRRDRCRRQYERCLRFCFRGPRDHDGHDHHGSDH